MADTTNPTVRQDGTSNARQTALVILWLIKKIKELEQQIAVLNR